jgi:hypothetical protein
MGTHSVSRSAYWKLWWGIIGETEINTGEKIKDCNGSVTG